MDPADAIGFRTMGTLATLEFADGSFERGFTVTLRIGSAAIATTKVTGTLPPNLDLPRAYHQWRSHHLAWIRTTIASRPICLPKSSQPISPETCRHSAQQVRDRLNQWLQAEEFRPLWQTWLTKLSPKADLRIILQTTDSVLQRLPWHQWDLFNQYPHAELVLSAPTYDTVIQSEIAPATAKMLAIFGNADGIDLDGDLQTLVQRAGKAVHILSEPTQRDLSDRLWQQPWRILFFAGHSTSYEGSGRIAINRTESLTIDELKYALRNAAQRGLKLAILNSCDGLDLAIALADLQIPHVIVMREAVPDEVAQAFLHYFLAAFAEGLPLHQSVRQARERLQALEAEYPCASWLPILYQNPTAPLPTWQELIEPPLPVMCRWQPQLRALGMSAIATTSFWLIRQLGGLQLLELQAFDGLMRLRPAESTDTRLLIVGIDDEDIAQDEAATASLPTQNRGRGSISDRTLSRLLKILNAAQPRLIGLDIYRDFSTQQQPALVQQWQQMPNLIAICRSPDRLSQIPAVKPPPQIAPDRVGFSDFVADPDQRIRRHLLFMDPEPGSTCTTPYAFSVQLAARYLADANTTWSFTPNDDLQFGTHSFPRIYPDTGGYATIDAAGNQILLNYRHAPTPFEQVTLRQILNQEVSTMTLKNRIILIGYTGKGIGDDALTPYGEMPGVLIHAHMTSQMISAIQDQRSLLWSWSPPWEMAWMAGWSLATVVISWRDSQSLWRSWRYRVLGVILLSSGVSGICYYTLTRAGWIPWVPPLMTITATALLIQLPIAYSWPFSKRLP